MCHHGRLSVSEQAKYQRNMDRGERLLIGPHVVIEVSRAVQVTVLTSRDAVAELSIEVVPRRKVKGV